MDYAEPLLELRAWTKCYSDAMRNKKYGLAESAAMKIMRVGADLIDHAEATSARQSKAAGRQKAA